MAGLVEEREGIHVEGKRIFNAGKSTQVPTGRMIAVKGRISRKIGYGGAYIYYERISKSRQRQKISFTSQVRKVNVGNEFIAAMEVLGVECGVN